MVKEIFFYTLTRRPKNDATGTLSAQTDFEKWHNQVENEIERLKTNVVKCASEGKNVRLIALWKLK